MRAAGRIALVTRRCRLLTIPLVLLLATVAAGAAVSPPDGPWLHQQVAALAAPDMEGRRSGTPGGDRAARYLADALTAFGVQPGGDDGTFFQSFVVATGTRLAPGNAIELTGTAPQGFVLGRDWMPHGGSPSREVEAEVVAVGYGLVAPEHGHDDYAGRNVRGNIALVNAGAPAHSRPSRLDKLITAREHGAVAVLVVEDALPSLSATGTRVEIPSASVTRATADALTARPGARVRLKVALAPEERRGVNVIGALPGRDPQLGAEAIVIGAHYDHLGRQNGVLYPGADDNASGTAVVLGLARAFADAGGSERTLVFALFGGEELGLLGSRHYVSRPRVPLERTIAMLNFDMVGRVSDDRLQVGGVDSGSDLRALVAEAARAERLVVDAQGSPSAPSDHRGFYDRGTPVLFFHSGRHADYHQAGDTADKINADGLARVTALGARLVARLASGSRPQYVKLAPPAGRRSAQAGTAGTAFFGIMGDSQAEGDGVRVAGVVPGSAAARVGVSEGDVIVRFGGVTVASFDEFQSLVRARQPGDQVPVVFLREGEARLGSVVLGARP